MVHSHEVGRLSKFPFYVPRQHPALRDFFAVGSATRRTCNACLDWIVCLERRHEYRRCTTVLGRQISRVATVRDCSGICIIHQIREKCCGDLDPAPKIEAASMDIFWI